jgi:hypothetical protein
MCVQMSFFFNIQENKEKNIKIKKIFFILLGGDLSEKNNI